MKRLVVRMTMALLVVSLTATGPLLARANGAMRTDLRAQLLPEMDGLDPSARGGVRLLTLEKGDRSKKAFHVRLDIDASAMDNVEDAMFDLLVNDADVCDLAFDEFDPILLRAEYNVTLQERNGTVTENAGTCDGMIPMLNEGDVVRIVDALTQETVVVGEISRFR